MASTYAGFRFLEPVARVVGLPIDQFNFVFGQLIALSFSFFFRRFLYKTSVSVTLRHVVCLVLGLVLAVFCFGYHLGFLVADAAICYLVLRFAPAIHSHLIVMGTALLCLSSQHLYRLLYDYGGYTMDISGPLMVLTQKLTDFAFCFHDGQLLKKKSELKDKEHEKNAIRELPSLLQYWSYVFYFQCILVGPLCFYRDYIEFMEGKYLIEHEKENKPLPSPTNDVMKKSAAAFVAVSVMMFVTPVVAPLYNISDEIRENSLIYRIVYLYLSMFVQRAKYYFAWLLADAVNNASGLGFNGYDKDGAPKWNLVTNIDVWTIETATNLKSIIDNWNIQTVAWLRRVCFSRAPGGTRTMLTYTLSAVWHGFYPGYYFTFISAAFFTMAGRGMRRKVRPFFLQSTSLKFLYDVVTWFAAQHCLSYLVIPFCLLSVANCIKFYTMFYWGPHLCAVLLCVILPVSSSLGKPTEKKLETEKKPAE